MKISAIAEFVTLAFAADEALSDAQLKAFYWSAIRFYQHAIENLEVATRRREAFTDEMRKRGLL